MFDFQRGDRKSTADLLPTAHDLVASTQRFHVPVYLLTNNKVDYQTPAFTMVSMPIQKEFPQLSLYFQRWLMAYHFLLAHPEIKKAAFTDLGDVVMLHNPFAQFKQDELYFSDEPSNLTLNIISRDTTTAEIRSFLQANYRQTALNPGVIAGYRAIVLEFLGIVANLIVTAKMAEKRDDSASQLGAFEMAIINYTAYRYFGSRLRHGRQVTTPFLYNRSDGPAWFKHK
ncbi:hypothetical protein IV38_GL001909 [Lactobacillus selangorensis]|uniref:Uncharacterized protein n=2 Tax=Lactobacillus selangorensis TaxID=81857 RepID=A0A0R2FGN5_9LACO|nr:hypothetical protein IV38_GL001909 [Lactobacillus selangorensis]KRN30339.1 hypothetical protein IV40_GL001928 [Lactobacillus selangorensis]